MWQEVGTVEMLVPRVYKLDPYNNDPAATDVLVQAGVYPLYGQGDRKIWLMEGELNLRAQRMGDGLFVMRNYDGPSGLPVRFPSKFFGPEDWTAFTQHPMCVEGHSEQRLRLTVNTVA